VEKILNGVKALTKFVTKVHEDRESDRHRSADIDATAR
jgi:hypothetical protein